MRGEDRIDLSAIDAKASTAGKQSFTFIGTGPFTAEGQVRVFSENGKTFVEANTVGTNFCELQIELTGVHALTAGDFIL